MLGEFKAPVREIFIKPKSFNFKNRIINGDFSVWQRGTTKTGITAPDYYTADRFYIDLNSGSFKSEKSNILGHNALRISVETPPDLTVDGNYVIPIKYAFEGQHLYDLAIAKKKITISFLFNSNVAGEYAVSFRNATGGTVNESFIERFIYPKANVPQKVKITIPLDTNFKSLANDENIGFVLSIGAVSTSTTPTTGSWLTGNIHSTITATNWTANAGNFIEVAKLQLEEGEIATEFEYVPYDIQLQRCMRYYEVLSGMFPAYVNMQNQIICNVSMFPKRTLPTPRTDFSKANREPGDQTDLTRFNRVYSLSRPKSSSITLEIECSTNLTPGNSADCSAVEFPYLELDAEL